MIVVLRKFLVLIALSCTCLIAAPVAAQAGAATTSPDSVVGYVLGAGDTIDVAVIDSPDYKARVTVDPDGTVVLPLLGRTPAAGRTPIQLREDLRTRLISGGFFVRPEVSVTLVTAISRYATILGEISTPGLVALDRPYHLSEVVARAGGVKNASNDTISLTTAAGETKSYSLRVAATSGGDADPLVQPGDKIFVAPAQNFYIYGQVSSPGTYAIEPGMTVRQALARGGGLTALGTEKKIKLHRGDREFKASLDEKIQPNDTITIGERFF